ncbi:MAG: hypothetical protein HY532_04665 [Chloroflexi bacterium]|nr:hypothetical protein [Chloroflexota bacterium]
MTSQPPKGPPKQGDVPASREPDRPVLLLLITAIVAYAVAAISAFSDAMPELVTWGALIAAAALVMLAVVIAMFRHWKQKQRHKSNGR